MLYLVDLAGEDKWEQVLVESALDAVADLLTGAIALGESNDGPLQKVNRNQWIKICMYRKRKMTF